jgi:hypothetical protein
MMTFLLALLSVNWDGPTANYYLVFLFLVFSFYDVVEVVITRTGCISRNYRASLLGFSRQILRG